MLEVLLLSLIQNQSSLYIYVTSFPNRMLVISSLTNPLLIHPTHTCHLLSCYTLQCYTTQVQIRFLTGPNLCFPKAFEQSTKFPRRKSSDMSPLLSRRKLGIACLRWHRLWQSHRRGEQVYIYIYIHHAQCKHAEGESKCLHP